MTANEETCTDCKKERLIVAKYKAALTVNSNGTIRSTLIDVKLCRGCMRKRAQAAKQRP